MKYCDTCHSAYPDDFTACPRDQSLLRSATDLPPGVFLRGKYEVLEKIGSGGMASVYRARHRAFGETVAIKVMGARLAEDEEFRRRFHNEAVVTRRLQHPSAVRVEDLDTTEDGRPFIVMEYVRGRSLRETIRAEGALPPARAVAIARQVAAALSAAHALGIVHRDIKPDNILLTQDADGSERAKVLDFGISKVKEGVLAHDLEHAPTGTGLVVGTPQYLSPEQAMGKRGDELDGRADLYSLGVVLYEMVTGRLPFQSDTAMGVILQHLQTPPTPPELVRPELNIPFPLSELLMKALEKDRDRRFVSAADMLAGLDALPALGITPPPRPLGAAPPLPVTPRPAPTALVDIEELPTLPRVPTPTSSPPSAMEPPTRPRKGLPWWLWVGIVFLVLAIVDKIDNPRQQVEEADRRAERAARAAMEETDNRIESAVKELLSSTPALEDEDIEVDVQGGRVELGGEARTRAALELAKALARTVTGVVEVVSTVELPAVAEQDTAVRPPPGTHPPGMPRVAIPSGVPPPPLPPGGEVPSPAVVAVRELLVSAAHSLENGDAVAAVATYKAAMMLDPFNREAQVGLAQAVAALTRQRVGAERRQRPSPPPPEP